LDVGRWWSAFSAPSSGTEAGGGTGARNGAKGQSHPDELHDLVMEHSEAVFRMALSVVKDRALAEDVAQETMVKAWLALPSFRGDSSLRGWILRIARNTAISTLRQRRATPMDPNEFPEAPTRPERSVESAVQSGLVVDEFVEALDTLDDLSRSVVVLRELEGLSYEEIAEILDVPMPTVKTRLLRSRRRLSAALREWQT
jgi:RNA polymerase sigma-70 factor (ECF subfamily)